MKQGCITLRNIAATKEKRTDQEIAAKNWLLFFASLYGSQEEWVCLGILGTVILFRLESAWRPSLPSPLNAVTKTIAWAFTGRDLVTCCLWVQCGLCSVIVYSWQCTCENVIAFSADDKNIHNSGKCLYPYCSCGEVNTFFCLPWHARYCWPSKRDNRLHWADQSI